MNGDKGRVEEREREYDLNILKISILHKHSPLLSSLLPPYLSVPNIPLVT